MIQAKEANQIDLSCKAKNNKIGKLFQKISKC